MLPNKVKTPEESLSTNDVSGVYNATNPAWVAFNAQLDTQLVTMEEHFRPYWTIQAVRASVGR